MPGATAEITGRQPIVEQKIDNLKTIKLQKTYRKYV